MKNENLSEETKKIVELLFKKDEEIELETIELFKNLFQMGEKMFYYSKKINDLVDVGYRVNNYNEKLIYHVERDFKNQIVEELKHTKNGKKLVKRIKNENLLFNAEVINKIDFLKEKTDLFESEVKVERTDRELTITNYKHTFSNIKKMKMIDEETEKEIIKDYKEHFKEFEEVLKWIVACRFTNDRRESFLHLLVNAGWGKSFFMGMLKELNLMVQMKYDDFRSPCGVKPEGFRNRLGIAIDEFTIFKKEFKELTNNILIEPKFGYMTEVEVYAKLFLSAEESKSFMVTATEQITDRVNLLDKRKDNKKLIDRKIYNKIGNTTYFNVICVYANELIKEEFENYVKIGKIESGLKAREYLRKFYEVYKLSNTTEKLETYMKKRIMFKILELLEVTELTKEDKELKNYLDKNEKMGGIVVKNPAKFYDLYLKNEDNDTQSKGKYLNINTVFETETKRIRITKDLIISGFLIKNEDFEELQKEDVKKEVEVEVVKDGKIVSKETLVLDDTDEELPF